MFKKFTQRDPALFFGIIFAAFSAFVSFTCISIAISENNFRKTAVAATAVITKISGYDGDDKAYVSYTTDSGYEENVRLNYYSSDMREGDEVLIYYDPGNPRLIKGDGSELRIFILAGLGFFAIGAAIIVSRVRKLE